MSEMFKDGCVVKKDLDEAIKWARMITPVDDDSAIFLYDLLVEKSTIDSIKESASFIPLFEKSDNICMIERAVKAYKYGLGVQRNPSAAIELLKSFDYHISPELAIELAELLQKRNVGSDARDSIAILKEQNTDNPKVLFLIACSYRDGKGLEKDIDKAKDLFRKAIALNYKPASNALFDILYASESVDDNAEAVEVIRPNAERGDGYAMGRLARVYRDGKGLEKDLDRAIDLMESASQRGVPWASSEVIQCYLERGTQHDLEYVYQWAVEETNNGNRDAMRVLSLFYRDGIIVEKNQEKAIELMMKYSQ